MNAMNSAGEGAAAPDRPTPRLRTAVGLLLILAAIRLWLMPLGSSLWLDECGTYWVVKDGLRSMYPRSLLLLQSPLYCFAAIAATWVGGLNEIALRAPSVLATLGAAALLYRLGAMLFDKEVALLALVVFVCHPGVAFAAGDARPYAFALLMLTGSLLALARWLDDGRWRHALGYASLAALTVHFHFLFAYTFLVHLLYATWHRSRGTPATPKQLAVVVFVIAALLAPLAPHLAVFLGARETLSFARPPSAMDLVQALLPLPLIIPLCFGGLAVRVSSRAFAWGPVPARSHAFVLTALSVVVPVLLLFAVTSLTPSNVFVSRYLLATAPGMALLLGYVIRCVRPDRDRWTIAGLALALSTVGISGLSPWPVHHSEDWRAALRTAAALTKNNPAPVVVYSGLVEASDLQRLSDPRHREYILAPLAAYPVSAPALIPLPFRCDAPSRAFFDQSADRLLRAVPRFLLVVRLSRDLDWAAWLSYIRSRMAEHGFKATRVGEFGLVAVWQFERRAPR